MLRRCIPLPGPNGVTRPVRCRRWYMPARRVGNKFMDIMKSTMSSAELSFENFSKQAYTAHLKFPPA